MAAASPPHDTTRHLAADAAGIAEAARLLAEGRLVAFPTETVYGLGADARSADAVAGIYRAKGRPSTNPLIVHVPDLAVAETFGEFDASLRRLAERFWPGPLTLVVPLREGSALAPAITAGRSTVGLRVPASPVALALLAEAGCPVAAPSANPSGRVSPTEARHVLDPETGLGGRIAAVLDGGPTPVGLESTIVAAGRPAGAPLRLLRPGGLALEVLAAAEGAPLVLPAATLDGDAARGGLEAPGMMASHYAPRARLRLGASAPEPGEAWLGFGADPAAAADCTVARNLSEAADLDEAARRLFASLRALDTDLGAGGTIAVAPIPDIGLGRAINDRLARAAAPRG